MGSICYYVLLASHQKQILSQARQKFLEVIDKGRFYIFFCQFFIFLYSQEFKNIWVLYTRGFSICFNAFFAGFVIMPHSKYKVCILRSSSRLVQIIIY